MKVFVRTEAGVLKKHDAAIVVLLEPRDDGSGQLDAYSYCDSEDPEDEVTNLVVLSHAALSRVVKVTGKE